MEWMEIDQDFNNSSSCWRTTIIPYRHLGLCFVCLWLSLCSQLQARGVFVWVHISIKSLLPQDISEISLRQPHVPSLSWQDRCNADANSNQNIPGSKTKHSWPENERFWDWRLEILKFKAIPRCVLWMTAWVSLWQCQVCLRNSFLNSP